MKKQFFNRNQIGFSLIELAIVIMIMGTLMTFGIKLATSFQNKSSFSSTANRQSQIKEALIAYLARNGKLPCPASPTGTGNENLTGTACASNPGIIPYNTLALPKEAATDDWERFFTYAVWNNSAATCSGQANFDDVLNNQDWTVTSLFNSVKTYHDGDNGCLMIEEADSAGNVLLRRRVVAVVVSHGPNGFGAYNLKGVQLAFPDATVENQNAMPPAGTGSVSTQFRTQPLQLNGFDDLVMEISANDLLVPLKRDGSILSLRKTLRDYLITNVTVSGCVITKPADVTITPNTATPGANPILTIAVNNETASRVLDKADYGCATSGFSY